MSPPINLDGDTVDAITIDGESVSEVTVGGDVVFITGPPDKQNLQSRYPASSFSLSDGDTISSAWTDTQGSFDAAVNGSPTYRSSATPSGDPAVEFAGSSYFDTGFIQDTTESRSLYVVRLVDDTANFNVVYGAEGSNNGTLNASYYRKEDNDTRRALYANGNGTFGTMTRGSFVIDSLIANNGTLEWYVDGSTLGTVEYTGSGSIGFADFIGARSLGGGADLQFEGQIADILRYDVSHGDQTRSDVETFLNDEYSVFLLVPESHISAR